MEIRNITTFLRVVELQSFTQAAIHLGYSQSAVTVQIKQLKQELGVQLFERIGKSIKVTDHGKQFVGYAMDILTTLQAAKMFVRKDERVTGTLQIGVIESLSTSVLPTILIEYQKLCPFVEISIKTGLNSEMFDMVRKNEIDIIYFLDKKVYRPEWVKVIERPEPVVFVASSEHPLTHQDHVELDSILAEPLVMTEKGYSYRYELDQVLAAQGLEIHPVLEIGNTDVIVRMLLNNVGISFLPLYVVSDYVKLGELSILKTNFDEVHMWSQLVYHKSKCLTPQLERFIDVMKQYALT